MTSPPPPTPPRLPVLPLPYSHVVLPGAILKLPLAERHDVQALLQKLLAPPPGAADTADRTDVARVVMGCVPLRAPGVVLGEVDARKEGDGDGPGGKGNPADAGAPPVDVPTPAQVNIDPASAMPEDLFPYGTVVRIVGLERGGFVGTNLVVEGMSRFRTVGFTQRTPFLEAEVEYFSDEPIPPTDTAALESLATLKSLCHTLLSLLRTSPRPPSPLLLHRLTLLIDRKSPQNAGSLADFFVSAIDSSLPDKLAVLAATHVPTRLARAVDIVAKKVALLRSARTLLGDGRETDNEPGVPPRVRSALMRPRGRAGGFFAPGGRGGEGEREDEEEEEVAELERKVEEAGLSEEAREVCRREVKRLRRMTAMQAEYQVVRTYVETLCEIPWIVTSDDQLDSTTLARARKQLDSDHYGLEKVKKRLLEYLAVLRLKRLVKEDEEAAAKKKKEEEAAAAAATAATSDRKSDSSNNATDNKPPQTSATPPPPPQETPRANKLIADKSPILLLVGPPGVGKTSLARSVAAALGRKFHRISLGGVRDEAEIRGHRRTYVAAMPGLVVNALRKVGVANPVILLDEIDKVGKANFNGDPSAAMLEVLDPEQNWTFQDHYVNIPLDLSKVLFICTANSLDTIPAPLLDRMETIHLPGYTTMEKKHIAMQYLIPKQLQSNGLKPDQVEIPEDVIVKIITSYTLESGVRNLEREIGSVCRAKAVEYASSRDAGKPEEYNRKVSVADLEGILGIEKYDKELVQRDPRPGVVTGLVAYSVSGNGSILFIEAAAMPGSGKLQLTGKLGEVIKAHAFALGLTSDPDEDLLKKRDVHVHCPAGAVPKDGPSAGVAFTIALISLFSGRVVPPTVAMTGETSLRGRVTAVGGIKEKLIGALAAGVKTVILPRHNRKDVKELPIEVKEGMDINFVSNLYEVMKIVWPQWDAAEKNIGMLESVL